MSDDDFEEELLAVAGGKKSSAKKRSKRAASESEDEDSEDLFGSDSEDDAPKRRTGGAGTSGRKAKGKAPPKRQKTGKRAADSEDEEDDDDDLENGYGSDLYENEEDRRKLEAMNELEREMILAERAEARDKIRQRRELLKKQKEKERGATAAGARTSRASASAKKALAEKDSALRRIESARRRREKGKKGARDWSDDDDEEGSGKSEDEEDEEPSEEEREAAKDERARSEEMEEEAEADVPRGRVEERRHVVHADEDEGDEGEAPPEDIRSIQATRTQLEAWEDKPFFTGDGLAGMLVRMAYGGQYMLMVVTDVKDGKPYPFGAPGKTSSKYLQLLDGLGNTHTLAMMNVSNQPLQDAELERYLRHCKRMHRAPLGRPDIELARGKVDKAVNFRWDSSTLKEILARKREAGGAVVNVAAEKARLRRMLEDAQINGRLDEAAGYEQRLADLETAASLKANQRGYGMTHINKRNMNINFQIAFRNVSNKMAGLASTGPEKAAGADAFSRRATRSAIYWNTQKGQAAPSQEEQEAKRKAAEEEAKRNVAELAKLQAPARLRRGMSAMDPAELITHLELGIDVSRAQGNAGGANSLPRRLLGSKWHLGLGRHLPREELRSRSVLSVADWKRRAGEF